MTVHFLKGVSARQLEEIQQQNNLVDHDAGLKCFGIWILCIDFSHTLLLLVLMKSSGKHTRMPFILLIWLWKKYCTIIHFWEQIFLQRS